jgi:hypothetical protein
MIAKCPYEYLKTIGVLKPRNFDKPLTFLKNNNYTMRLITPNDTEEFLNKSDMIFRTDEPTSKASNMEEGAWKTVLAEIMK